MKHLFSIVSLVIMVVSLLAACGGGDSPETAVREWMQALMDMDGNKLIERTCEASQSDVQQAGALVSVLGIAGKEVGGQSAKADLSSLTFQTISKSNNAAQVRVQGKLRVAFMGLAQEQPYDQTVPVVLEDGKWKACDLSASTSSASQNAYGGTSTKPVTPTPQIEGGVELVPLSITRSDAVDGYANVELLYAIENHSNYWARVGLQETVAAAKLSTIEGFDYATQDVCDSISSFNFIWVPPSFRMRGEYGIDSKRNPMDDRVMGLNCKVAAKTSGYQLHLPYWSEFITGSGSVHQEGMFDADFENIQNASTSTFISGDETAYKQSPPSGTLVLEPGQPLETPFGKISFDSLEYNTHEREFVLRLTGTNNSQGYGLRFEFGASSLFMPDGKYVGYSTIPRFPDYKEVIGPGQTETGFMKYSFFNNSGEPPLTLPRMCFAFNQIQYVQAAQTNTGNRTDYVQPVVVCFPSPPVTDAPVQ